jgi:hypothetical protein
MVVVVVVMVVVVMVVVVMVVVREDWFSHAWNGNCLNFPALVR